MPDSKGVMVAFFLPEEQARVLALQDLEGAAAPEDLHITLAYLGEYENPKDFETLPDVVRAWSTNRGPLSGTINGYGRFVNAGDNGQDAIYLNFDSPDLPELRQSLMKELMEKGIQVSKEHGFIPHITLAYVDPEEEFPINKVSPVPLSFDKIHVCMGDNREKISLAAPEVISHQGDKWILYSKDRSKKLGTYDTEEQAKNREKQVQFFKHQHEGESEDGMLDDFSESDLADLKEMISGSVRAAVREHKASRSLEWVTVEEIREFCPSCAEALEAKGINRVRSSRVFEGIPSGEIERFTEKQRRLGKQDPHFFKRCMSHDFGKELTDKKAFCAWLHHRVLGKWPGEHPQ